MKVEVWSDVACPWCYIGKRRFAEGVRLYREEGGREDVHVEYRSFELAPDVPADSDISVVEYLARTKGLPVVEVRRMVDQVAELLRAEGVDADFDAVHQARTLKAHELLHLAKAHGLQEPMKERLMSAYFVHGRHVGRLDDLVALADEVGLDPDEARAALRAGTYASAVAADIDQARAYGITGVPFYVIDGRFGVSGAQAADTFAQALAHADRESIAS